MIDKEKERKRIGQRITDIRKEKGLTGVGSLRFEHELHELNEFSRVSFPHSINIINNKHYANSH